MLNDLPGIAGTTNASITRAVEWKVEAIAMEIKNSLKRFLSKANKPGIISPIATP